MQARSFTLALTSGLGGAAVLLVLAAVLDAPTLRYVAVAFIVATLVAREAWTWRGHGRAWLAMISAVLAIVAVAFVVRRLGL